MNSRSRERFTLPAHPAFEEVETEEVIFHGEPLTDERVTQIVDDVRQANLIPGGKSLNGDGTHSKTLSVRLPDALRAQLDQTAGSQGMSTSRFVRRLLDDWSGAQADPER